MIIRIKNGQGSYCRCALTSRRAEMIESEEGWEQEEHLCLALYSIFLPKAVLNCYNGKLKFLHCKTRPHLLPFRRTSAVPVGNMYSYRKVGG